MIVECLTDLFAYGMGRIARAGDRFECTKINSRYAYLTLNNGVTYQAYAKEVKKVK